MLTAMKAKEYGLEAYHSAEDYINTVSLEDVISNIEKQFQDISVSVEDVPSTYNAQFNSDGSIEGEFTKEVKAVTEEQKSKMKEWVDRIIAFFRKIFQAVVTYIKNLREVRRFYKNRDKKNIEILKKIKDTDIDSKEFPISVTFQEKFSTLLGDKRIDKMNSKIHSVRDFAQPIESFYTDFNKFTEDGYHVSNGASKTVDRFLKQLQSPQSQASEWHQMAVNFDSFITMNFKIKDMILPNYTSIKAIEKPNFNEDVYSLVEVYHDEKDDYQALELELNNAKDLKQSIADFINLSNKLDHLMDIHDGKIYLMEDNIEKLDKQFIQFNISNKILTVKAAGGETGYNQYKVIFRGLKLLISNSTIVTREILRVNKELTGVYSDGLNRFTRKAA